MDPCGILYNAYSYQHKVSENRRGCRGEAFRASVSGRFRVLHHIPTSSGRAKRGYIQSITLQLIARHSCAASWVVITIRVRCPLFMTQAVLTAAQFEQWKASTHRPLTIAMAISSLIRRSGVSDMIALEMEQQVGPIRPRCPRHTPKLHTWIRTEPTHLGSTMPRTS
eukprot:9472930-Pyramimonas_sp.AAC.1